MHAIAPALEGSFIIPVTVDDLAADGLLEDEYPQTCWERSVETLIARKDEIAGLAVASGERLEAYLFNKGWGDPGLSGTLVDDGGARLKQLLSLARGGPGALPFHQGAPGGDFKGNPGVAWFPPSPADIWSSQGGPGPTRSPLKRA